MMRRGFLLSFVLAGTLTLPAAAVKEAAQAEKAPAPIMVSCELPKPECDAYNTALDRLIESAKLNNTELQKYVSEATKRKSLRHKFAELSHDMLNYTLLFKGVSPSSEAGDVILGEKSKLKSLAAAKYLRQKLEDTIQLDVTVNFVALAAAVGTGEGADKETADATQALVKLAGQEKTDEIATFFKTQQQTLTAPEPVSKPLFNITQRKQKLDELINAAAARDAVVAEVRAAIHHYNKHSKAVHIGHRVARTALCATSFAPNLAGPAAQIILFGYLSLTGGTEEEKVLRELYIGKRLSSRANLLGEQAHLALHNYQLGAVTGNQLLMDCSEKLAARLGGSQLAEKLLSH